VCLFIVSRKMWASEIAEISSNPCALSSSLDVWVLLGGRCKISRHQMLSTQGILIQGQIEEGLFLVKVASTFSILKRKGGQHVVEPV
jgi:hypothetical protein